MRQKTARWIVRVSYAAEVLMVALGALGTVGAMLLLAVLTMLALALPGFIFALTFFGPDPTALAVGCALSVLVLGAAELGPNVRRRIERTVRQARAIDEGRARADDDAAVQRERGQLSPPDSAGQLSNPRSDCHKIS